LEGTNKVLLVIKSVGIGNFWFEDIEAIAVVECERIGGGQIVVNAGVSCAFNNSSKAAILCQQHLFGRNLVIRLKVKP
jgi:tRNA(Phe) wybutosine-synthesizing methylase Tyw3